MKKFSKVALAAVLVASMGSAAFVAPAMAKKEEKPKSGDSFNLSKEVRDAAIAGQTAITNKDLAALQTAVTAMEAAAKNDDERYIAATMRFKLVAMGPQNAQTAEALVGPLDTLIASPRTPAADKARYQYTRGDIAYNMKQYPQALQFYTQAKAGGVQDDELSYQIVRSTMEGGDVVAGATALDALVKAQIAAGKKPPENWYRYAISRLYKANKTEETAAWTANWLAAYGTKANWRDAIYTFGFQGTGAKRINDRQRVDLYRLMQATNSLAGQRDYIDYGQAAIQIGLPTEAKSVLQAGQAAQAIPAGNKTVTDQLAMANTDIAGDKPFPVQEKNANASPNGSLASQTGDAYLGARNLPKAIAMYDLALTKGGVAADTVHLHRAIAYALSGDKEKAKADFAAVTTAPDTEIAKLWLVFVNTGPAV